MKDKIICKAKYPFLWAWIHVYMCRKHQAEAHTNHKSVFKCRSDALKRIWIVIIQVRMFGNHWFGPNSECITINPPPENFLCEIVMLWFTVILQKSLFSKKAKKIVQFRRLQVFPPKKFTLCLMVIITPYVCPKTFKTVCYNCRGSTSVGYNKLRSSGLVWRPATTQRTGR